MGSRTFIRVTTNLLGAAARAYAGALPSDLAFATLNHAPLLVGDVELRTQLAAAADAGYPMVSVDMFSIRAHLAAGGSLAELAGELAERGLSCLDLAGLTIGADADRTRAGAEELLEFADALSSKWVQVRVVDEVDDAITRAFAGCVEAFGAAGVGLAVEFSPLTKVRTIADARALLRAGGGDGDTGPARTGIIVDSWHFFRGDDDWPDLDELSPAEVAFVQFSDGLAPSADAGQDTLHRRALPGDGEFDLSGFAGSLRAQGFDGPVSVEVLSEDLRGLPVHEFARRSFETTAPYWR